MNKTLIDNSENLKMVDTLRTCIATPGTNTIRIATGYWDIPGTALVVEELLEFLSRDGAKLKLLIGKDPYVYAKMLKEPKYMNKAYPQEFIRTGIDELADNLREEHTKVLQLLLKFCEKDIVRKSDAEALSTAPELESKIEIRIFKKDENDESQFLHSKCYIFTSSDDDEQPMHAIVGSSNFTEKGLQGNAELNVLENDPYMIVAPAKPSRKGHITWFEEKWEQAEDWTQEFLEQVLKPSKPVQEMPEPEPAPEEIAPLTPYELYIKLLQTKFGAMVDKNLGEMIESYLPEKYDTYDYQIDAVKQCFSTMKEHGGFMLADVVGLGKTIVGTLLIKHFLQFLDEDGRDAKVLVVTPPAIQSAWKNTIADFDGEDGVELASHIDFITTGSIGKLTDDDNPSTGSGQAPDDDIYDTGDFNEELKQENYGLIIIDESHKFRNSGTAMYEAIDNLIAQIGANTGCYPYIGLLSATPQNNRPSDLQNQIYLFERNHAESTLKKAKGGNLEGFFADINRRYSAVIHDKNGVSMMLPEERNKQLKELSKEIRDCVLADVMVRRTRTDVMKYYAKDIEAQGITFPTIQGPISLQYRMSKALATLFYNTMDNIAPDEDTIGGLRYYRYRAIQYLVDPENKKKYDARGSRDADTLAEQLAHIMQINLVKRLESSFTAFKQSLMNLRQYTKNMIDMWEHDAIFVCPDIDVNAELDRKKKEEKRGHKVSFDDCIQDLRNKIDKLNKEGRNDQKNNCEYHRSDFDAEYIENLSEEYEIINDLCERWMKNSEDPKFDEFKENLRYVLFDREKNVPQKLVVFTEAIDTADSIVKAAEAKGYRVLKINAANRNEMEQNIRENFDANYGNNPKHPEEVRKNDYDMIVTTDVLAEGINLHRANCILNYDTPWNSTRLMQRIGRVNRIGSTCDNVYVYNFMPSAEGDREIKLVQKAHTKLQSFHTLFGEDSQIFSEQEEVVHYKLNTMVNGEESPLEKYIYELKQYKDAHPERYEQIMAATEGLHLATTAEDGSAYFLVQTPRMSGMFVAVEREGGEGRTLSVSEGLEAFRQSEDVAATDLPGNWDKLCREACRVLTAELASVRLFRGNSQKATDAKGAIIELKRQQAMSAESKKLLNAADRLVRHGNHDIVKAVLRLDKVVKEQNLLIPYTQEEFDEYLRTTIAGIVATAQEKHGEPFVFIGTYK